MELFTIKCKNCELYLIAFTVAKSLIRATVLIWFFSNWFPVLIFYHYFCLLLVLVASDISFLVPLPIVFLGSLGMRWLGCGALALANYCIGVANLMALRMTSISVARRGMLPADTCLSSFFFFIPWWRNLIQIYRSVALKLLKPHVQIASSGSGKY